ncbi:hypothetical protein E4L95_07975 [Paracoccus liaowanqingii]|uniref:Uncharacterized protein n=1 Tax=Paracoccus liaowanqingii TaxID=2560053 RepID=A0A4Z1BLY7_9RHOB|nr:hypothetical protein [Paracoccus liaowanqingii]TGN62089.1 hypothetical protein E4L95_07975 [Paracoccus liaowanqingii]
MTNPVKTIKLGGKAAALAMLMATASFAQTATTEAPAGMTTMEAVEFPTLTTVDTDEAVAEELVAQGYENIVIVRSDDALAVTAERGGVPTEMVFSPTEGTLVLIDGVAPMAPETDAAPVGTAASTDGDEPVSETADSTNFSGQDDVPLDTPTASIEGDEVDPVAETIPVDPSAPTTGETGQAEDGGAETDGTADDEGVDG